MQRIEWTPRLSVGVPLIDQQHQSLIGRIRDLAQAVEEYQGIGVVTSTLNFLIEYADYHFSTEEKHMTGNDYPGLEYHKGQHEEFRRTLANLETDFQEEGSSQDLAGSIKTFLFDWFVTHIDRVDRGFGAFLAHKGVVLDAEE
ncbi:hemerythrin family protein [Candidatus Fermentibacteria bacterium]|nr:hemerythrin family protein [Candidatus Fermentibacteria bacterium]